MAQNVAADYTVDYGDGTIETFSSAPWTAGKPKPQLPRIVIAI
ncbi:hypothetical protein [sulfur-oxidizing endosymbiont of Gigantopelta aegis]|nr:hypothetical protein [sulfur-oxidizing endosymbiont of Gigantopelta aegis]